MKKLWFKAKRYGMGWYPASIEGWVILTAFCIIFGYSITAFANIVYVEPHPSVDTLLVPFLGFTAWIVALIWLLIYICLKTGEKLQWRWGDKKDASVQKSPITPSGKS